MRRSAYAQMLPELQRSCAAGDASNCSYLAWLYRDGRGVGADLAKSAGFVALACAAGDKPSCVEQRGSCCGAMAWPGTSARERRPLDALCEGAILPASTRLALSLAGSRAAAERNRAKALLARACEGGETDACSLAKQLQ